MYSFEPEKKGHRPVENFPEISIDTQANGYRLPTFDELRFAGIHGDFKTFWTKIATDGMLARINPPPNSSIPTYSLYPNAWGFHAVTGNFAEMVVDNQWNIGLAATGGAKIQLWNDTVPFTGELSSKIPITGFRIVQGPIENRLGKK